MPDATTPAYQATLDYLYSFLDSEKKLPKSPLDFNLPRNRALLDALGTPDARVPTVVVAGSKGKGSTSVLIEAAARAAGYRTGLWTSPHLHSYRERIQIDGAPITRDELVATVAHLRPLIDAFDQQRYGPLSVFEVGFGVALWLFAQRQVELAVIEVGLGGLYDSANVLTPLVSVITSISYDHVPILGTTLAEIAAQKAGILKPNVPAITIEQHPEAADVIAVTAERTGTPLHIARAASTAPATPNLGGAFQAQNAQLAAGAARLLRQQGLHRISDAAIAQGFAGARWPARFELVPGAPTFVIDGAHNGDSAAKLRAAIRERFGNRPYVLITGGTQGHSFTDVLAELVPDASELILTRSRHPRAMRDLAELERQARPLLPADRPITVTDDPADAVLLARQRTSDLVVVTGSLFIAAAARETLGLPHERD